MLSGERKNRLTFESVPTRHHINPTRQRQIRFMKEIGLIPAYIQGSNKGGRPPVKIKLDPILINLANELILYEVTPPPLTVVTVAPRDVYEEAQVSLTMVHPQSRTGSTPTYDGGAVPVLHSRKYIRPDFILTANALQKDGSPSTDLSAVEEVIQTAKNYISRFGPIYGCCAIYEPLLEGNFDETLDKDGKAVYDETYDYYRKDPYKFVNLHTFKVIGWSGTNWIVKSGFGKAFGENGLFRIPFGTSAGTRKVAFEYLTRHRVDQVHLNPKLKDSEERSLIGGFFIIPKEYVNKNLGLPPVLAPEPKSETPASRLRKIQKRISSGAKNDDFPLKVLQMVILAILLGGAFWMLKNRYATQALQVLKKRK